MKLERMITAHAGAVVTLALAASASAQQVSCKDVAQGVLRHGTTPYHIYVSRSSGNKSPEIVSEMIGANNALYSKVNGKWSKSTFSLKDRVELQREQADSISRTYTCTRVGSENVNGVTSQHYHIEGKKTEDGVQKEEVWLGPDGLIQQIVVNGENDDGTPSGGHMTMRYEYTNVQAPPGVK